MSTYLFAKNGMGNYETGTGMREDMIMQMFNMFLSQAGVYESGDLLVTERAAGANMSVDVAPGRCFVENSGYTANTANSTKYWGILSDAVENIAISQNTSGSTRYDIIVVEISATPANDYATNVATVKKVEGLAGSGVPATPANSYKIAEIEIPDGTTSQIVDADITDFRTNVSIDVLPVIGHYETYDDDGNIREYIGSQLVSITVPENGAVQSGIDAISAAGGGEVRLVAGDYYPTSEILVKQYVSLRGVPTTILHHDNIVSGDSVLASTSNYIRIRDLRIDIDYPNSSSGLLYGMQLRGPEYAVIDGVHIYANENTFGSPPEVTAFQVYGFGPSSTTNDIRLTVTALNNSRVCDVDGLDNSKLTIVADESSTSTNPGISSDYNIVEIVSDRALNNSGVGNQVTQAQY